MEENAEEKLILGLSISSWKTILGAFIGAIVFFYATFVPRTELEYVEKRITETQERQKSTELSIDRKFEIINEKLDKVLLQRSK